MLIVDDHPAVREGLAIRISRHPDLTVCGEASDVAEALQLVASARPDVAIIDIALKTGNGIDLIKRIKAHNPGVHLLVLSMYNETLYAERALRAGALGYINKGSDTDKVIEAIRRVRDGKVYLSEPMAQEILSRVVGGGGDARPGGVEGSPVDGLSDRELEVFELIGQGMSTHQIAEKMRLSPKTVETYRSRIKEKLNVRYGTELMQRAVQWVIEKR